MATFGEMRSEREVEADKTVMQRVQSGMRLLEKEYGPDWVEHIDLLRLDLGDSCSCVLGQLYRHRGVEVEMDGYEWALENLDSLDGVDPQDFGFDACTDATYRELTETWTGAIEQVRRLQEVTQ